MNTDHEFDMLSIGSDFREAGIAAHAIQITLGKCTTKEQYTKLAKRQAAGLIVSWWGLNRLLNDNVLGMVSA